MCVDGFIPGYLDRILSGIYFVSTMSYLDNGSTLRSMFRLMPPQRHDADPDKSEVLAYIRKNLTCELGRAIRAFNSMRNKKSQVIVYDMVHRQWRGCDWVPAEDGDQITFLTRTINEMKREMFALKSEVRKHARVIGQLERKRSSKRREDEEPEPEPEPAIDPEVAEAEKRAAECRKAMQKARETIEDEKWRESMLAALSEGDTASPSSVPPQ